MYQNIYTPLQHLRRPKVRPAGVCWIVFARKADVIVWPKMHPANNLAYTPIQLAANRPWYQLLLVNKDRVFTEKQKSTSAGPSWEHLLSGYFGGSNTNHVLAAGIMPYEQYVLIFEDRDGTIRMLGNEDAGATYTGEYTSGEADSSRKRILQFAWQHPNPAPVYIGSLEDIADDIIEPPFAKLGDFNNDFNDDFDNN